MRNNLFLVIGEAWGIMLFWAVSQAFRYSPVACVRFCWSVRGLPAVSLRLPAKTMSPSSGGCRFNPYRIGAGLCRNKFLPVD